MYELFDCDTGNVIGTYPTERAALDELREAMDDYGMAYADNVILGSRDEMGYPKALAGGAALIAKCTADVERDEW